MTNLVIYSLIKFEETNIKDPKGLMKVVRVVDSDKAKLFHQELCKFVLFLDSLVDDRGLTWRFRKFEMVVDTSAFFPKILNENFRVY